MNNLNNLPFFSIERKKGRYNMPSAHFHNFYELYFLISGKTKYFINGEIFMLSAGDIILVPSREFHQTDYPDPDNIERVIFTFNDDFAGDLCSPYVSSLLEHKHFQIPKAHIHMFNSLIRKLEAEYLYKPDNYENMEKLYMCQLLILLLRYGTPPHSVKLSESHQLAQDAAKFINANYNQNLTLGVMAKKYSMSADYFSKIFKKATGVGFSEYLNITRISAAQELLATTAMSATNVAMECGFNDSNYFIQVFKKIHGTTPKKYSMQFRK